MSNFISWGVKAIHKYHPNCVTVLQTMG